MADPMNRAAPGGVNGARACAAVVTDARPDDVALVPLLTSCPSTNSFPPSLDHAIADDVQRATALNPTPEPLLPPAMAHMAALAMSAVRRDGLLGQRAVHEAVREASHLVPMDDVAIRVTERAAMLARTVLPPAPLDGVLTPPCDGASVAPSDEALRTDMASFAELPSSPVPPAFVLDPVDLPVEANAARTILPDLVFLDARDGSAVSVEIKRGGRLGAQHRKRLAADVVAAGLLVRDAVRHRGLKADRGRAFALSLMGRTLPVPSGMALDLEAFDARFGTRAAWLVAEARRRHRTALERVFAPLIADLAGARAGASPSPAIPDPFQAEIAAAVARPAVGRDGQ